MRAGPGPPLHGDAGPVEPGGLDRSQTPTARHGRRGCQGNRHACVVPGRGLARAAINTRLRQSARDKRDKRSGINTNKQAIITHRVQTCSGIGLFLRICARCPGPSPTCHGPTKPRVNSSTWQSISKKFLQKSVSATKSSRKYLKSWPRRPRPPAPQAQYTHPVPRKHDKHK